ncbi:stage II sporulation protein R [Tenuibacillus multivorans]|uniref:Stage II sporulation protein R n=1 Tax=Tenuibacillus multivorans TaxID=237069 RepID=A0A1G9X1R6_9BACI|nr:stage II sporulation protein R [Tenuibacillus multivorans]GEL77265.1 stage II sporulation protein R [Tenuibacillus multivorans]SDM90622.1 stage II sporulation protein R [Tenuibacillus multivorans]
MRYIMIGIGLIIVIQVFYMQTAAEPSEGYQVIPDEAIRLRILANSNSDEDQAIKREVRDRVNAEITEWVEDLTSIEQARHVINQNMNQIEAIVADTVNGQSFSVEFGDVEFPDKIYDNYVYPAGTYEAILITIGEGQGDNWWCVLFPPLCFVDFANGATVLEHDEESDEDNDSEEEKEDEDDVEVKFFLWEWIKKIFNI